MPSSDSAAAASTRGRRNRVNGAYAEREVARWLKPWFPDATRAIRSTYPDPGDIDLTSPGLFWSVKNCQVERISEWMTELDEKGTNHVGLLVVRRKGHASPGEWWCWLHLHNLIAMVGGQCPKGCGAPVRMELRNVMSVLVQANYAPTPKVEVSA